MSSSIVRTALVDADGIVVNVIVVNTTSDWQPPEGHAGYPLPDDSNVGPGWTHDGTSFVPPPAEPAAPLLPTTTDLQAQIDQLMLAQLGM